MRDDMAAREPVDPGHRLQSGSGNGAMQMTDGRQGQALSLLAGMGLGAALMYFLDPDRGARRRHLVGDQVASIARKSAERARAATENARNHATGRVAELKGRVRDEEVSDPQLEARVRAELGHHVEHVRPIEVHAENGVVTLRGAIPEAELSTVVATVSSVRGVVQVENQLQPVTSPG